MSSGEIKLTVPEQLDAMSQAHRAHGEAAHAAAEQVNSGHQALQGTTNWSGPGFDDISGFLNQFVSHLHAFGNLKQTLATSVTQAKENSVNANTTNAQNLTTQG
jgi:uncharacterized protein YukE